MPCTGSCVGGELMQVGLVSRKGRASSGPCVVRSHKLWAFVSSGKIAGDGSE